MKYIGNYPEQEIVHTWADRYDYVFASDPTITVNPAILYATWLNSSTGEVFVCTDNTIGNNVWKGNFVVKNIPTNGLVFKSGSYTGSHIFDDSGLFNDATASGLYRVGENVLSNNGVSGYLNVGNLVVSNTPYAISAWIQNYAGGIILSAQNGTDSNGFCRIEGGGANVFTAGYYNSSDVLVTIQTGTMPSSLSHHVIMFDGTTFTYIANNIVIGTKTDAQKAPSTNQVLEFGRREWSTSYAYSSCDFSNIRVYNRELSLDEVSLLYNEGA